VTKAATIFRFVAIPALTAAGLFAQITTSQKIGVIDMQSALTTTKDGQKASAELRAKYTPKQQQFQQRQNDIQQKQEQYRRTENTISDEAKAKLAREIDTLQKNLQRDTQDAEQDMNLDQQRTVQELSGKMMKVISKYAQDHQFQLVFDVAGQPANIYFASNTIDITRDIIALYDQENPGTGPTSSATTPTKSSPPAPARGGNGVPASTAHAGPK
jgi:outer membrane protein